jgi:DNA-directed RNA polymerase specialized sigma24 family protein
VWHQINGYLVFIASQDAQDLTQGFFVMIMERTWLGRANPERGRFRSLLLKSLTNFLNDASERRQARKRGGAAHFVTWDDWMAEATPKLSSTPKVMEDV